jgi:hypothetical protein
MKRDPCKIAGGGCDSFCVVVVEGMHLPTPLMHSSPPHPTAESVVGQLQPRERRGKDLEISVCFSSRFAAFAAAATSTLAENS